MGTTAIESARQQASSAPVSAQKRKNLSRTFKRYRRKSMAPLQSFDIDAVDENVQREDEEEKEEVIVQSNAVTVCEYHRNKSKGIGGYECTKCECYLTDEEKRKYDELLRKADEAEAKEDYFDAMECLMAALEIKNQDISLHQRAMIIGNNIWKDCKD